MPLPPKIDPSVTMMTVEEKPDVTYDDVGGSKEMIDKLREVVEAPLLSPEKFTNLGIDPPKGVLCYGPPGTGKTLLARAVANRTDACFIRVIGSELVQKYVGEGARMVRELFEVRICQALVLKWSSWWHSFFSFCVESGAGALLLLFPSLPCGFCLLLSVAGRLTAR